MATMRWRWDAESGTYWDTRSGEALDRAEVRRLRDELADDLTRRAEWLAEDYAKGVVTEAGFREGMEKIIRDGYGAQYVYGRGGINAMTPDDWLRLGKDVTRQFEFLDGFLADVNLLSDAERANRAGLYGDASVAGHGRGTLSAWGLDEDKVPGDGDTKCGVRCRCHIEVQRRENGDVELWWLVGGRQPCPDCAYMAGQWNPLVIRKRARDEQGNVIDPVNEPPAPNSSAPGQPWKVNQTTPVMTPNNPPPRPKVTPRTDGDLSPDWQPTTPVPPGPDRSALMERYALEGDARALDPATWSEQKRAAMDQLYAIHDDEDAMRAIRALEDRGVTVDLGSRDQNSLGELFPTHLPEPGKAASVARSHGRALDRYEELGIKPGTVLDAEQDARFGNLKIDAMDDNTLGTNHGRRVRINTFGMDDEVATHMFDDYAKDLPKVRRGETFPAFASGNMEDVSVHELGHQLDRYVPKRFDTARKKAFESMLGTTDNAERLAQWPSSYGTENIFEMTAESITRLMTTGPLPGPAGEYGQSVLDYWIKKGKKVGKR